MRASASAVSGPEDPVAPEARVPLELGERAGGVGAEDAVFLAGIEAERVEAALELDDVVAAEHGAADVEHPVTEAKTALDQRGPRLVTADTIDP